MDTDRRRVIVTCVEDILNEPEVYLIRLLEQNESGVEIEDVCRIMGDVLCISRSVIMQARKDLGSMIVNYGNGYGTHWRLRAELVPKETIGIPRSTLDDGWEDEDDDE